MNVKLFSQRMGMAAANLGLYYHERTCLIRDLLHLADVESIIFPDSFFDLERAVKTLQDENKLTEIDAIRRLLLEPSVLFQFHQIPFQDRRKTQHLKSLPTPDHEVIVQRTLIYARREDRIPPTGGEIMDPETRMTWGTLKIRLREEDGTSLSELLEDYFNRNAHVHLPDWRPHMRRPSLKMPPNNILIEEGLVYREHRGVLPKDHGGVINEDGALVTWPTIYRRVKMEQGKTYPQLVAEYEQRNPYPAQPISARMIFFESARIVQETGAVPDKQHNDIMVGTYSARGLHRHFQEKAVVGMRDFLPAEELDPKSYRYFLIRSGIASLKGDRLQAAHPQIIEELLQKFS